MKFNIVPNEGTDILKFGMTSQQIRNILQIEPKLFRKSEFDLIDTEDYQSMLQIAYELGKDGILIAVEIEFSKPSEVFLDNFQLIGQQRDKCESFLKSKLEDVVSDAAGFTSMNHGISIWAPILPDKDIVQAVCVFRRQYREKQSEYLKNEYKKKYENGNTIDPIKEIKDILGGSW